MIAAVQTVLERALAGVDLCPDEGLLLLQQTEPQVVERIRQVADRLRQRQVGDTVTYVVNRNINFTNICEQHCSFCAFRRDADEDGAYWLSFEQIREKAAAAIAVGATEICMQGGLNPTARVQGSSLAYYEKLVQTIKQAFPQLHLHAFSPQEIQFISREDRLTYATVIAALRDAGVGSMPGTAAEVLDDNIRRVICPEKLDAATWVEIVGQVHQAGVPTTSTIMSGHIETSAQQIAHLEQLRRLQQRAVAQGQTGITEFIILPFVGETAPRPLRNRVGRDQPVLSDNLRLTAVARIYLSNWIKNHQPSWVKLGLDGAVEALRWGCNDIGGTLMEEHITSMAGAIGGTCQTVAQLQAAIARLDRPYQQRDTLYQPLSQPAAAGRFVEQS